MRVYALFLFCLVMVAALPLPSVASEMAAVNVDKVMSTTKAAKSIASQLKSTQEKYQKEFSKREQDLLSVQKKLVEQKASLSEDDFRKKRKDFEQQLLDTQKLFEKRRAALTKAVTKANTTLQAQMLQSVAGIADERKFKIVFDRRGLVIVEESIDITEDVIADVNKKLPDVKLEIE